MRPIRSLVIVVHHFNLDQLKTILRELQRTTSFDNENRCVIIDVPSTPESREFLSTVDWADVISCNHEYYQRASWNMGFKHLHAKYYFTCHTDIKQMTPGWRRNMIVIASSDPVIGAVGCFIPWEGSGDKRYLATALTLFKHECLEDTGLLDEEFDPLFSADDEEWGTRAVEKGWRLVRLPKGSGTGIEHLHGQSGRLWGWEGIALFQRKIKQKERKDIEYLSKIPEPSGLILESEKKKWRPFWLNQKFKQEDLEKTSKEHDSKYSEKIRKKVEEETK